MYGNARSKKAVRGLGLDDVAIVPARRTRGIDQISLSWQLDALTFVPLGGRAHGFGDVAADGDRVRAHGRSRRVESEVCGPATRTPGAV